MSSQPPLWVNFYKGSELERKIEQKVSDDKGNLKDSVVPAAPSTTVDIYNNTEDHRVRNAALNWGAKLAGGAAGVGATYAIVRGTKGKKLKPIKIGDKKYVPFKKEPSERGKGVAIGVIGSVAGSAGSYGASRAHSEYVKRNPKYGYKKKD